MASNANNLANLFPVGSRVTLSTISGVDVEGCVFYVDPLGICLSTAFGEDLSGSVQSYFPWTSVFIAEVSR